jgi:hypothetical protein
MDRKKDSGKRPRGRRGVSEKDGREKEGRERKSTRASDRERKRGDQGGGDQGRRRNENILKRPAAQRLDKVSIRFHQRLLRHKRPGHVLCAPHEGMK